MLYEVITPFRGRTNLRNHRKAVIADGSRVWAGGANIAAEYIGPTHDPLRWRDLSFLLEGPATRHYRNIFLSDWQFATRQNPLPSDEADFKAPEIIGHAAVQVVPSGPDVNRDPLYSAMISAVFQARKYIRIVTPYFVPDETLVQALHMAVHRGVKLQILVPGKSNHWLADMARGPYLRDLQAAGGSILLYPYGMLHGKAMLVDDTLAVIGSANFDMRSLFLNYRITSYNVCYTKLLRIIGIQPLPRLGEETGDRFDPMRLNIFFGKDQPGAFRETHIIELNLVKSEGRRFFGQSDIVLPNPLAEGIDPAQLLAVAPELAVLGFDRQIGPGFGQQIVLEDHDPADGVNPPISTRSPSSR